MNRIKIPLLGLAAVALIAATASGNPSSDFEQILNNPKRFNGKRVTLVGVAEIGGSEFFLYPDVPSAKKGKNAIFVDAHIFDENPYEKFNNHWLKITGIVDTNLRPPLGIGACSIVLEHLEPLPLASLQDDSIRGVFRNDTGRAIDIKFSAPSGAGYIIDLPPGQVSKASVISKGVVTVSSRSGKLLVTGDLIPSSDSERYFDTKTRTYYYRITDGKIILVSSSEAEEWNHKRSR
jgi:hypothetical protein